MKWYPFSEIISDVTSKFKKIKASEYKNSGRYKIIDQGKGEIAGYTDDKQLVNTELFPVIVFGDHTRVLKYVDTPIALGADGAKAFKINYQLANSLYIYYYLRTIKLKDAGYSRHFKFLKETKIPILEINGKPDFEHQKRIAYLLSKVEGLIAQRKQHLQHLDDLLKSIFLEMFGDPVRNAKGWETKTLGKLASSFKYGTNVKSRNDASNGIPVLRIPNIIGGKLDLTDIKYSNLDEVELEKTQLIEGDLLLVRTNGNPEYIGRSAVFDITEDIYAYASYLIRVRFEGVDTIRPDFLNFVINFPSYRSSLVTRAKTTAGNYNINTASLKTLIIPLPPIELQNQFATIVEKIEGIKSRYQQSLADLETLYGALSQIAFKGELDLSRVPLPPDDPEAIADPPATHELPHTADTFDLPAPSDLATLNSPEGRTALKCTPSPT